MSAPKITADAVRHVARLACISLSADELTRMQRELDAILGHMAELERLDVSEVPPTFQAVPVNAQLRPDVVRPGAVRAELLASAPASEHHAFAVPKVLDGD
jgi:aspartyl-tRNA(Asn)/glutamyl-tRNA(Gln) amidotransferase subunit C